MTTSECVVAEEAQWQAVQARRRGAAPAADTGAIETLYGPLCTVAAGQPYAVGHLAQSLDGHIATRCGASRWLSGEEDLIHTHRLRALADAVLVGAETVRQDDPLLTVRRCSGPHPVRVVIDAGRRLGAHHRVFTDPTAPTLLLAAEDCARSGERVGLAEVVALPRRGAFLAPATIRAALAARGLFWLFVEGGGVTISHFLAARCLDRLQLAVTPVLFGSGRPAIRLPEIADPGQGLRPEIRRIALGLDTLFDCRFDG